MQWRTRSDGSLLASERPSDFGAFYDRHLPAVAAYVGSRVPIEEVAFDIVAETFARALEHRDQFDAARGPAIAWLIGIARNLVIDGARRGRIEASSRERLGMRPVELDDEAIESIAAHGRAELREALAGLPDEVRESVLRRVVLEEDYASIATRLECSEQVVRKRVSRGLKALRGELEEPE
jgi:RNA polymerase sigma-70 factor (ECF subfamily)